MTLRVKVRRSGPLVLECEGAPVEIVDAQGRARVLEGMPRLHFCRCGASETPPLCDGSHHRVRFERDDPGKDGT